MNYLLVILISLIIFFIVYRYNTKPLETFSSAKVSIQEAPSLNEWGQNAMSYLCNMDTDSMPEKYQFVKFCDKMVRTNEYNKFLVLAVDKPSNFKYKILKYKKDFFYSPTPSKNWYKNVDKKALGKTLGFYKMNRSTCEKLANQNEDILAINIKNGGCEIKNSSKLIDLKNSVVYTKSTSIQFTISFWLKIENLLTFDRNILQVENSKNRKIKLPQINVNKEKTSLKFTISTTDHNAESIEMPTGNVPYKKWCHIAFTLNGRNIIGYVNSKFVLKETLTGDPILPDNNTSMYVNKKSSSGIIISKLRIIPVAVPRLFIKNILVEEDPMDSQKYLNCLKKYKSMGKEIAHSKCLGDIFKADDYSNDNNINGRNLQLLNEEQYTKSWISKYYRRPSYKIVNGIVYLSGLIDNVFGKGKILVLPKEARPDKILFFNSGSADRHVRLDVMPKGFIEIGYWSKPNGTVSLDSVTYPLNTGAPLQFRIPLLAYFVKISKPGRSILNITEVEVYDDSNENIAKGKMATASSSISGFRPYKAIDGKVKTKASNKQMWISKNKNDNYLLLDLQGGHRISKIKIINRTDSNQDSVAGAKISILDMFKKEVSYQFWDKSDYKTALKLNKTLKGLECENWHVKNEFAPPVSITGKYNKKRINSYVLTDKKGNELKNFNKSNQGSQFNFSCKPGFIKSYEHTSNWNSLKNITCSNGKVDSKTYGEDGSPEPPGYSAHPKGIVGAGLGNKVWKGERDCLEFTKSKGGAYFQKYGNRCYVYNNERKWPCGNTCWKVNMPKNLKYKKWNYKDYSNKGISDHNYCRQTPKHSTWGSKKRGGKLWCYTKDKNTPWGYCGRYGKIARNAKEKFYKPEKVFVFNMTETVPTGFKPLTWGNWKDTGVRPACYTVIGNLVFLSGFLKFGTVIPVNTFIDQLPSRCRPKTVKIFNVNTNDGVARIHITEEGKIQYRGGDSKSRGIKGGYLCLDGINYCIEDKLELKLNSGYESQAATSSSSLNENKVLEILAYNSEDSLLNKSLSGLTGNMSISFNIKANENGRQVIFDKGYGGEGALSLEPDGKLNYFYGKKGGYSGGYQTFSGPKIQFNEWTNVALIRDISNKKLKFFIDGKMVKKTNAAHSQVGRTAGPLKIGHGWINKFSGSIKNMVFYKRALTNLEVKKLNQSSKGEKINYGGPKVTKHSNGLVTMSGVIGFKLGKVIENVCDIHEEVRPNKMINFFTNQDDKQAMITITPEGKVKVSGATTTSGILTLDGISYFTNKL